MSAVLVAQRDDASRGQFQVEHLTAEATAVQLAGATPCHGRSCFTGYDVERPRVSPDLLGDAVLATARDRGVAISWTLPDPREPGAETLFVADLDGSTPVAALEAVKELLASAGSRGIRCFVCSVPLESGWLVEMLRTGGLQVRSQEWLGGVAELRFDA
jgi:hypothetical protein